MDYSHIKYGIKACLSPPVQWVRGITLKKKRVINESLKVIMRGLSQSIYCVCYVLYYSLVQVWVKCHEYSRITLETSCAVWMACRPGWGCLLCRQSEFHGRNREGWRMQPWGRTETGCREGRGRWNMSSAVIMTSVNSSAKNKTSEWS